MLGACERLREELRGCARDSEGPSARLLPLHVRFRQWHQPRRQSLRQSRGGDRRHDEYARHDTESTSFIFTSSRTVPYCRRSCMKLWGDYGCSVVRLRKPGWLRCEALPGSRGRAPWPASALRHAPESRRKRRGAIEEPASCQTAHEVRPAFRLSVFLRKPVLRNEIIDKACQLIDVSPGLHHVDLVSAGNVDVLQTIDE